MKKGFKVCLVISIIMSLLLSCSLVYAESDEISLGKAKQISAAFINSDMKVNTNGWRSDIKFKDIITMYNLDGLPSAYLVELIDKEGNDSGYVVVSANKNNVPIIEFSYDSKPFIEDAITAAKTKTKDKYNNVKDDYKIYYLGGLDYFVEISTGEQTSAFYDTSNGMVTELDKKDLKKAEKNTIDQVDTKLEWESLLRASKNAPEPGDSTPPTSGGPITSPDLYESAYSSSTSGNVTSYNLTYKTTTDFSGYSGHCAPTAGVNIAMYWNNRGYALYDNNNWNTAFSNMHSYMGTTSTGSVINQIGYGVWKYFKVDKGVNAAYYDDNSVTNADIKSSITTYNRPFLLYMASQYYYCPQSAHEVLALGWKEYSYDSSGYNSMYIRIADGWTNYASRFIHKEIGTGLILMHNVYPQ